MRIIIATLWILISIQFAYSGISNLLNYSTPGILWNYMKPITLVYFEIIMGALAAYYTFVILNNKNTKLLSLMLFPIFIIIGIFEYHYILSFNNSFLIIILIVLYFYQYFKKVLFLDNTMTINGILIRLGLIVILNLVPLGLAKIAPYNFYYFLH